MLFLCASDGVMVLHDAHRIFHRNNISPNTSALPDQSRIHLFAALLKNVCYSLVAFLHYMLEVITCKRLLPCRIMYLLVGRDVK